MFDREVAEFSKSTRILSNVTFFTDTKEVFTERQYIKVQEVLANLGGFLKALLFLAETINNVNSKVSLFNSIYELNYKLEKKGAEANIRFNIKHHSVNNQSHTQLEQANVEKFEPINLSTYLKHLLCFRFKEISKIKEEALRCIDIDELLKARVNFKSLEKKVNSVLPNVIV